jgi:hypothetical protein
MKKNQIVNKIRFFMIKLSILIVRIMMDKRILFLKISL